MRLPAVPCEYALAVVGTHRITQCVIWWQELAVMVARSDASITQCVIWWQELAVMVARSDDSITQCDLL